MTCLYFQAIPVYLAELDISRDDNTLYDLVMPQPVSIYSIYFLFENR